MKLVSIRSGIPYLQDVAGVGSPYDQSFTLLSNLSGAYSLPLSQTYNVGQKELLVVKTGIVQTVDYDYTETSTTQITLLKVVTAGSTIRIRR